MGNVTLSFSPRESLTDFTKSHSQISLIKKVGGAKDNRNKIIHGENLTALAALKAGAGVAGEKVEVDIIYIDPPYNVGGNQGYNNVWKGKSEKERDWAGDHGKFLDFMEPRLKIGRSLLKPDGIIMISICDGEYTRLQILMEQVFGEENCLGTFIWDKGQGSDSHHVSVTHEYVIAFAKNKSLAPALLKEKPAARKMIEKALRLKESGLEHKEAQKEFREWIKENKYNAKTGKGFISSGESPYNCLHPVTFRPLRGTPGCAQDNPEKRYKGKLKHPVTGKNCPVPSKGWKWKKETLDEMARYKKKDVFIADTFVIAGGMIYGKGENKIPDKLQYLDEKMDQKLPTVIKCSYGGDKDLPEGIKFSTPKPIGFLKVLLKSIRKKDAVILDYFAGSGATAHAVDSLNREDGGDRTWIMIEEMGSTFNKVMKKRLEKTISDKDFGVYELKNATVADEELMTVFGEYSKDFISAYHLLDDNYLKERQGLSVVGYDDRSSQIVGIINPERRSGKYFFEQELKILKDQIKKSKAKKCLLYTINYGADVGEEQWLGLDKSILSDTPCKSLRVVEIPEQLVKEWTEVLTAMAA